MKSVVSITSVVRRQLRLWQDHLLALLLLAGLLAPAYGQLRVDISGVGATQYPIAVVEFEGDSKTSEVAQVIRDDLTRSGLFQLIRSSGTKLNVNSEIKHDSWRDRGADYIAYGRSEEHTSELQSRGHIVCRLLLEYKNTHIK